MNSGLVREFEKLLGPSSVLYRPEDLLLYRYDRSVEKGRPELVVFPHSTEDVLCIAKLAAKYNVPIVGRGVGTGLSGGALARTGGVMPQRASPKPPPKFSILFLPPAATPRFCSPRQHSSALFASRTVMRDRASTLGAPRAQTYPSCTASNPPSTSKTSSPPAVFCLACPERNCRSQPLPHSYQ